MFKSKPTLFLVLGIGILLHATPLTPGASSQSAPTKKTTAKKSQPATPKKTSRRTASTSAGRTDRTTSNADPSPATKGTGREELRGIWITTDSPRDWDAVMKRLKDHNLNAAFVRIGQGGKVIYPSKVLPQDQWSADTGEDELAKAVAAARRHGIQFHAWKVCFVMNSARSLKAGRAANEFYDTIAREDRLVRDPKGVQGAWLDPSDPRNHDLEARVAREVASNYALDGYHLDYIRYPDLKPGFDFHYGAVARREFEKELGRAVENWPTDVISGSLKLRYEDWERDNITRLVRRLGPEIKSQRPATLLSAAVFRNIHGHRAKIKQDWPRWCREGLLDFVVPMSYETELDTFRTVTRRDLSYACGRTPYMAGIGGYLLYKPEAVVDQVQAARELGTDGFVIFSINDPTDDNGVMHKGLVDRQLAALAAGPTWTPAVPGLGGPRFKFQLSPEVVHRPYEPPAIEAGGSTPVGIRLADSSQTSDGPLAGTVSVEDLRGRTLDEPLKVSLASGEEISLGLTAFATSARPVIRGVVGEGKKPFVVRGPIVEPV
ncbi:MAG: family 10 glycosylhydrolase, partial [Planctomycetes bacterium]|nr:family 10 glycosylhydrolase [Planctomycetota bacterium]